jgi:hypothetical protein
MLIRLFIKTTSNEQAMIVAENLLSLINDDIEYKDINTKPYWKFVDMTIAEIQLELFNQLQGEKREEFLNSISNRWLCFGDEELLSSDTMENCKLNYDDLKMINIFFD